MNNDLDPRELPELATRFVYDSVFFLGLDNSELKEAVKSSGVGCTSTKPLSPWKNGGGSD
jgi:hypothetical protein